MSEWRYIDHGTEGNRIRLDGIDVWKHDWVRLRDERAVVTDPQYGQEFRFPVYQITHRGRTVEFAAGEYSNGVWGFYMREPPRNAPETSESWYGRGPNLWEEQCVQATTG